VRRSWAEKQKKKQQQQGDGVDEQLHKFVQDPEGFPKLRGEYHEQELMNFVVEEYDVGASFHASQSH
jgi:hypothetical protein